MGSYNYTQYLWGLDSSRDGSCKEKGKGGTSNKLLRSAKGGNVRINFIKHMDLFLDRGWACSYNNETSWDKVISMRYMHYVKKWEPNPLLEFDRFLY